MKNKIIALFASLVLLASLAGCDYDSVQVEDSNNGISMFTIVEKTSFWEVVYHNETKVMYAVGLDSGTFTLLVNADGTPMIYNN